MSGDEFAPATSYLVVATKARDRWFDLDAVRTESAYIDDARHLRPDNKLNGHGNRPNGLRNSGPNPAGAPPLDWFLVAEVVDPEPMTPKTGVAMGTARFIVGDVLEQLRKLPDASVDLVLSSPPFLALRSYLPSDHADKGKEIGSEPTPGEFLDTILDVVEECARVLTPHGSLVFEFGDSFAGSGGAGGDYADDGWRDGQERFGGSASKGGPSKWSRPDALWLAGVIDTEGCITVRHGDRGEGQAPSYSIAVQVQMMDPQVVDRAYEITGVGHRSTQKGGVECWQAVGQQARYILLHIWPYLLIKKRQALAGIELQRHIEDSTRRGQYARVTGDQLAYRKMIREYVSGLNARGEQRGVYVPTWDPPEPKRLSLPEYGGVGWPMDKSLAMIPESFAWALAYGRNPWTGRTTDPWRIRNFCPWVRPNPPVGALGDKFRPGTSYLTVACKARDRWFDLDSVRTPYSDTSPNGNPIPRAKYPDRMMPGEKNKTIKSANTGARGDDGKAFTTGPNPAGAPPLDWFNVPTQPYAGSHYATWPEKLALPFVESMCPRQVCNVCGQPRRRITQNAPEYAEHQRKKQESAAAHAVRSAGAKGGFRHIEEEKRVDRSVVTLGWTECDHPGERMVEGSLYRPGVVLDPFAGSGTTLQVATGCGRDAIGIDLDARNLDLARARIGLFLVEEAPEEEPAA